MEKTIITASLVLYNTSLVELKRVLCDIELSSICRLFVIDNSPTDILRKNVNVWCSKVEYVCGQGNIGYGAAHNIAIQKSIDIHSTYHVIINPDVHFETKVIDELASFMRAYDAIGLVMPKVVYPNGELQYLCKLLPTPLNLIGRRFIPIKFLKKMNDDFEMRASNYDMIMDVPFLSGCFMFLRMRALNEVSGFSEEYWMYCEDLDLSRKIGEKYRTVYYPYVSIIHDHHRASYKNNKLLKAHIKSAIIYFNKWGWFFDSYRKRKNKEIRRQYNK